LLERLICEEPAVTVSGRASREPVAPNESWFEMVVVPVPKLTDLVPRPVEVSEAHDRLKVARSNAP